MTPASPTSAEPILHPPPENRLSARVLLGFVLAVTLLAYLGTLHFQFVYDDNGQIAYNPLVQSWRFAPRYLVEHMWSNQVNVPANFYRPMFLFWCLLNYTAFGLQPLGWHATAVTLHLGVTWLTYRLARRLGLEPFTAALAALVFGLHPVHVESVAWVSGVTDPLMSLFFVASFLAYLRARQPERRRGVWLALALASYFLAMLCKETGIVLVVMVAAYELIFSAAPAMSRLRTAARRTVPFGAVTAGYLALRYVVLRGIGHPVVDLPAVVFPLTWPMLLWFYVRKLLWPVGLSPFYDTPYVTQPDLQHFTLPLLALVVSAVLFWLWWRRLPDSSDEISTSPRRVALFCLAWIFVPLGPVLDIVSLEPHEIAHDRYLYLPLIGFAMLVAMAVERLPRGRRLLFGWPLPQVATAVVLASAMAYGTVQQAGYWATDLLLFYRATNIAPSSRSARNNLANALLERGFYDEGIQLHQQILRGDPSYWLSHYSLGNAFYKLGRYDEAEQQVFLAAQLNPANPQLFLYLGMLQMKTGHLPEAEHNLREAVRIWPKGLGGHYVLGKALEQRGKLAEAAQEFERELALDPDQPKVRSDLEAVQARVRSSGK